MSLVQSKSLQWGKKQFMHRWPRAYIRVVSQVARYVVCRREDAYLAGRRESRSTAPSVVYLAYNRCASMYVAEVIARLTASAGLVPLDLGRYVFHVDPNRTPGVDSAEFWRAVIEPVGYAYGPFRTVEPVPALADLPIVLSLRDPRDVLTSRFFSVAYSHSPQGEAFLAARSRAQAQGIDAFALERMPEVRASYQAFLDRIWDHPRLLFLPYEDMVNDFRGWVTRLAAHVVEAPDPAVVEALIAESDFEPDQENPYAHKRSVRPGNYLSKLQPATIAALNEGLAEVMAPLGYAMAPPSSD